MDEMHEPQDEKEPGAPLTLEGPVYRWVSKSTRADRIGQSCRVVWKKRNSFSVIVEFLDGERILTTQGNVRLRQPQARIEEAAAQMRKENAATFHIIEGARRGWKTRRAHETRD